jgi:hypothetical protein
MTLDTFESGARFVDAGNLVSFVSSVPELPRNDILDSTLLAQLAGDKKCSRIDEPGRWQNANITTLGQLAWQVISFSGGTMTPPGEYFALEDLVLDKLAEIATQAECTLAHETIARFRELPIDDPRVETYARFVQATHALNLQVSVVDVALRWAVVNIAFTTQQTVDRLFDEEFSAKQLSGPIETWVTRAVLNEDAYAAIRQSVVDKLGPRIQTDILSLDKPPAQIPGA